MDRFDDADPVVGCQPVVQRQAHQTLTVPGRDDILTVETAEFQAGR